MGASPEGKLNESDGRASTTETRIKAGTHHQAAFEEVGRDAGCTDRCYELAAHTARAALTCLRKRGYALTLERQEGKPSIYRISVGQERAAA